MSLGGMLASALGGGAQAVGQIAQGDIAVEQKAELARLQSEIDEKRQARLAEFQANLSVSTAGKLREGELNFNETNADRVRSLAKGNALAQGEAAREVEKAGLGDTQLQSARSAAERAKALDAAATQRDVEKAGAADTGWLAAKTKVALADPQVAAHIAQMKAAANASNASAASSAAHAGLLRAQTVGVQVDVEDKKRLSSIYDQMDRINTNANLAPEERAKQLAALEVKAMTIQGRSGKAGEKPDSVETRESVEYDDKGNPISKKVETVRKGPDRGQPKQDQDPIAQARDAVARGASIAAVNERLKAAGYAPLADNAKPSAPVSQPKPKPEPEYKQMQDGRMVDVTTGRTLTPEQSAVLEKIQRGEPTSPRERALLRN